MSAGLAPAGDSKGQSVPGLLQLVGAAGFLGLSQYLHLTCSSDYLGVKPFPASLTCTAQESLPISDPEFNHVYKNHFPPHIG